MSMKMQTSDLTGAALDWAVAKCEGIGEVDKFGGVWVPMPKEPHFNEAYTPSTNWAQGGPIIEREKIELGRTQTEWRAQRYDVHCVAYGPTPLIAAMRCYVASKLGDTVDVPDELNP